MSVLEVAGLGPAGRRFRYGRKTRFGEDCDLRYRHTLGNLVFTHDNSACFHKPFRRKQFDRTGLLGTCFGKQSSDDRVARV